MSAAGKAPPITVLIVDDDVAYANFVREAFTEARGGVRFELDHVGRLSDVLPALARRPATVILLDINLPDGNGLAWLSTNWEQVSGAVLVLSTRDHAMMQSLISVARCWISS